MKNKLQTTEKWIYYFMCGFALASCLSVAGQNIFLVLSLLALIYRVYLKHDDIKEALTVDKHLLYPFLAWAGAIFLSVVFSSDLLWSLWAFCDSFIYRFSGALVVLIAIRERNRLIMLLKLCFCSLTIAGGICLYQFISKGFKFSLRTGGAIPIMSLAGVLSMLVPLLFLGILLLQGEKRLLAIVLTLFSLSTVVLNGTRGMWMAVFFSVLTISVLVVKGWKKKASIVFMVLLSCMMLMSIPHVSQRVHSIVNISTNVSNTERICLWQSACLMFRDHPLLGVGFGNFEKEYQTKYILPIAKNSRLGHAHNNIMQMVGDCGAVGTVTFLIWWLYSSWYNICCWFATKQIGYLMMFIIMTGLLIQGLTEYNLGNSLVSKYFWFAIACCIQWSRISSHEKGI